MNTLIAMHGLPRSGKSTAAKSLARWLGVPIVNADAIRWAIHDSAYDPEMEDQVKWFRRVMIDALFRAGHTVVIYDETNWSREARDVIKDEKWNTWFYEVHTTPEVCKERAVATGQDYLIPVIDEMMQRVEPLEADEQRVGNLGDFVQWLKRKQA